MNHRWHRQLWGCAARAAAIAALGPLAFVAAAQDGVAPNPFLPPGFGVTAAPPPAAGPLENIELSHVLSLGGKTFVTLHDKSSNPQRSFYVEVGETVNNIKVVSYALEGDDDTVTLESGGKTRRVNLRKAKIVAMAAPPPSAVPLPPGAPPGGGPPPPVVAGQPGGPPGAIAQMSDEEVRQRMQRVAEEIRRRRAVRREMLETPQQNQ